MAKELSKKPRLIHKRHALSRSTGPGSINAESEMQRLVRSGQRAAALNYWHAHHNIRGVRPMTWGGPWVATQLGKGEKHD